MDRNGWAKQFIDAVEAVHGDHNAYALVSWMQAEHSYLDPHPEALWNPLNCTLRVPGSTDFNPGAIGAGIAVQNYPDFESGLKAIVRTIEQTDPDFGYVAILRHMRADDRAGQTLRAVEASSWGTGGLALRVLPGVKADYWKFARHRIAGS